MEAIIATKVARRNPFRVETVPLITRIYKFPFEKWPTPGKQALFGAFNIGLFYAYQRLVPIAARGSFLFNDQGTEKRIHFDGRNTQFGSVYFSLYAYGYEPEVTALLDVLISNNDVFYDIGSNWGYLSLFVASKRGFKGKIHAFEPFPPTYADLQSVIMQAGVSNRVVPHNEALSDQKGEATMRIPDLLHSGWATIEKVQDTPSSRERRIQVTTLDALDLDPPFVMKIDAEKAEARIIKGGQKLLQQHRPMIVFESLKTLKEPRTTLEPFWLLRDFGYQFFRPCWLRRDGEEHYFLGGDSHTAPVEGETLALVPLQPEERFLAYDQLNVFACHQEKLPHLRSLFSESSKPR